MRCPNCGNEEYELLDYAIARCTNCYSLWDPYVYPGFPVPNVEVGEIWDTSEHEEDDLMDMEDDKDGVLNEQEDEEENYREEEFNDGRIEGEDEDTDFDEDPDDWNEEEGEEQEDDQ